MYILGISAFYHDSAAALLCDGEIVAAVQEERFTRIKHDPQFPSQAIQCCLQMANIELEQVSYIVFYDKPLIKFERLLETYLAYTPLGLKSYLKSMPVWIKEKLFLKQIIRKKLLALRRDQSSSNRLPKLMFNDHHNSHASSAFYPSPFKDAAILCLDGVGEWSTTTAWHATDRRLKGLWQISFPHSLGLLYSAFTYFCGFKVNSGEYKLMGLAPYGQPKYKSLILSNLIDVKDDGSFRLNMLYFDYAAGLTMTNQRFARLFDGPARKPESDITQREMDLAASIQAVTELIVLRLAKNLRQTTGSPHLCLAGGVALNCVANGKLQQSKIFDQIWIQPAAGDAGGALGSAFALWHQYLQKPRKMLGKSDRMQGSFLGPSYDHADILAVLDQQQAQYEVLSDDQLFDQVALHIFLDE